VPGPTTGVRSATNDRSPAHGRVTLRNPNVVMSLMASMARAISSSSGRASTGALGVSSAGEHSSPPGSGLKHQPSVASRTIGHPAWPETSRTG
jgi:hypothetical protein